MLDGPAESKDCDEWTCEIFFQHCSEAWALGRNHVILLNQDLRF